MSNKKLEAKTLFQEKRYQDAMKKFEEFLFDKPNDLDAKIGFILSDMAQENELDAKTLYDFYENARKQNIQSVNTLLEDLLKENFGTSNEEIDPLTNIINTELAEYVLYSDFLLLVEARGDFKRAFEDLIFSTKIVIDSKEDFVEFITNLLENGYTNTALNFLENAIVLYPHEEFFKKTLGQIEV